MKDLPLGGSTTCRRLHQTDTACSWLHQTDTACSWLVCHSRGLSGETLCKLYPATPPLRRPGRPVFLGSPPRPQDHWTSGCLLREWRPCRSGGRDAWQDFSRETGLSDPSTATRRGGRSTTTTASLQVYNQFTSQQKLSESTNGRENWRRRHMHA